MKVNELKIDGGIYLDGLRLEGIKEYNITHAEGRNLAELTLRMDVVILPILSDKASPNLNCLLDKNREGTDSDA